MVYTIHTAR